MVDGDSHTLIEYEEILFYVGQVLDAIRRTRRPDPADGLAISVMPSSYRAAALARAHNDWIRERWLAEEPRVRGSIGCPTQDPLAAAAEIRRRVASHPAAADEPIPNAEGGL